MERPKKLAAIDLLIKSDTLKPALSQDSANARNAVSNLRNGVPVEISPGACRPWKLADRPLSEANHKYELAQSFQETGTRQIQPIVVRKVEDPETPGIEYEVICGQVRWLAAKQIGIPVQAIVRELTDQEAYALMSTENRQRRNLSDFAKAKSYQKALAMGVFDTAQQLADSEGVTKSKLSLYLGFAELPDEVVAHFSDITRIPYRLGYEIYKTCQMLGVETVLRIIPKIESGELLRADVQNLRSNGVMATSTATKSDDVDPDAQSTESKDSATDQERSILRTQSPVRNTYLSASGKKLFTFNNASRGWLIRIAPEISSAINEDFMRELGNLIESHFDQPK